ncbi:dihydroorotate dehydrogenase electron transfer subunit [candidate division FCPU426 bacterium]|nr:dihydroorotate dehydrogenase electron transfer subunit [candidate division FCPU426 bacterium]
MKARIVQADHFRSYHHFVLKAPRLARQAKPGQFVEVKIEGEQAPFWRRPFAICRVHGQYCELLVKTVGRGTGLLAQKTAGEEVDVLGPLGRGFSCQGKSSVILVGGGFGVAPLLFLAEVLRRKGRQVKVLMGGGCRDDLLLRREMKQTGATVVCTTEDGSAGAKGLVTKALEQCLRKKSAQTFIAAAGPRPMLQAVARLAKAYHVPAEVSLEEMMACGLGVCNGCVVKAAGRYQRVCKDGPVFDAHTVAWEERTNP